MYELKSVSDTSQHCVLEEEKTRCILDSISYLGTHMHTYFFYQIVKRNLNQLLDFIDKAQNTLEAIDILECNRLLFNFADTFHGYINFFESNYKETFEPIKKDFFDNNFEYAFIYKLRNYIVHEDLPIFRFNTIDSNRHNLRVTINTDDLGIFHTSLDKEFSLVALSALKKKSKDGNLLYQNHQVYQMILIYNTK